MSEFLMELAILVKKYEDGETIKEKEDTKLYTLNEIINLYPSLSTYLITKAINENKLKVIWIGNRRHFYKKNVESFINSDKKKIDTNWRIHTE